MCSNVSGGSKRSLGLLVAMLCTVNSPAVLAQVDLVGQHRLNGRSGIREGSMQEKGEISGSTAISSGLSREGGLSIAHSGSCSKRDEESAAYNME